MTPRDADSAIKAFEYQDRTVAFIDVLGFAELVKQSGKHPTELAQVNKLLAADKLFTQFVSEFLRPFAEAAFFSDSFVLSVASPENQLIHLVRETGYLCRYLLLQGLPCSGAIATGPLHHDGRFVVGPALVEAHRLEQSVSIYPRVILDDATTEWWKHDFRLIDGRGPAHFQLEGLVKRDRDGCHFLDIFNASWPDFLPWTDFVPSDDLVPADHVEFLRRACKQLDRALVEHVASPKILQKYPWLAAEFNESARSAGAPLCLIAGSPNVSG